MFFAALESLGANLKNAVIVKILELSERSSAAQQMACNLYAESNLPVGVWENLIEKLLAINNINVPQVIKVIRDFCRENSLKGRKAEIEDGTLLGRVMTLDHLCNILVRVPNNSFEDDSEARSYIETQILQHPNLLPNHFRKQPLGIYLMWATFNADGGSPFGDPRPSKNRILSSLGLPFSDNDLVLLLEYRLPRAFAPKIPTFCDAYASEIWSPYFRAPLPNSVCGRTFPRNPEKENGRPEVVHEVIQVKHLVSPMRYL